MSLQGLERYGVGKWREISSELLPRWDETTLRVKASRLFGSQSLALYPGWKGNRCNHSQACKMYLHEPERLFSWPLLARSERHCLIALCPAPYLIPCGGREAVEAEFKINKEIGEKTGCWKTGYLVEDDNGSVKQALEELKSKRA